MQSTAYVVVSLLMAAPLLGLAAAEPAAWSGFRATLEHDLATAGLTWDAMPDPLPLQVTDLSTGAQTTQWVPLDQVVEQMDAGLEAAAPPQTRASDVVVGDVAHTCQDSNVKCYLFFTKTLGPSQGTLVNIDQLVSGVTPYGTVRNLYDGSTAHSLADFPLHGGSVVYVHGQYYTGGHRCVSTTGAPLNPNSGVCIENGLPGTGVTQGDQAMWGAGAGFVYFFSTPWGCNPTCNYISFGQIRAHGVWRFCPTQSDPDCAPPV